MLLGQFLLGSVFTSVSPAACVRFISIQPFGVPVTIVAFFAYRMCCFPAGLCARFSNKNFDVAVKKKQGWRQGAFDAFLRDGKVDKVGGKELSRTTYSCHLQTKRKTSSAEMNELFPDTNRICRPGNLEDRAS